MKTLWDLSNPSDPITFYGEDLEIVALAVVMVGDGQYGADTIPESEKCVPIFLFGGCREWWLKNFNKEPQESLEKADKCAIAEILDSFLVGSNSNRAGYELVISKLNNDEDKLKWRDEYHDKTRSSMNDICSHAWKTAAKLREKVSCGN